MLLPDVNVFVNAFRPQAPRHREYRRWLLDRLSGPEALAVSDLVLSAFVRVVTQPAVVGPQTPERAIAFVERLRRRRNVRVLAPGDGHWPLFISLCRTTGARGMLVADAYHAALAIEHDAEWVTDDGDFARFPGLHWRRPLEP
jgi:toxin-antitoxin system PIN domain toxin